MAAIHRKDQGGTLKEIRSAAFHLFGRFGYNGVSIMTVAKEVGITKAAMYWHYDSKVELYLDCLAELHGIFYEHLDIPLKQQAEPALAVMTLFQGVCRLLEDERIQSGVAGYWLPSNCEGLEDATSAQEDFNLHARTLVQRALQQGVAAGKVTEHIRLAEMAAAIYSIIESFTLTLGHDRPVAELHRQLGVLFYTFFRAYEDGDAMATRALQLMRDEISLDELTTR